MKEKELNTPFSEIEFDFTLTGITKRDAESAVHRQRVEARSTHAALRPWNRARSARECWHHKFGAARQHLARQCRYRGVASYLFGRLHPAPVAPRLAMSPRGVR
jgi:hypothetical protein